MPNQYSRKQLISEIETGLTVRGYQRTPGPSDAASALWFRLLTDLVLTLGLQFSTRYTNRFTAAFYLAPSFEWSYVLPDYPMRAYERLGIFLTIDERRQLLDPSFAKPEVIDAWWIGFDARSVESFLRAVELTEPRFLAQHNLRDEIAASREMAEHVELVEATQRLAASVSNEPGGLRHQPKRYEPPIPPAYHWGAEQVLCEHLPDLVSRDYVSLLARDAWRIEHLR